MLYREVWVFRRIAGMNTRAARAIRVQTQTHTSQIGFGYAEFAKAENTAHVCTENFKL